LQGLIYDKLSTGFYGIRQAFKANDPQGKGNVSRYVKINYIKFLLVRKKITIKQTDF
jgi:hypothetical protein